MNDVKLSGRLTKDPEMRTTSSGTQVATFTLAVDRNYGKGTDFIRCVAWEKTAEFMRDYIRKGMKIIVPAAELRVRTWEHDGKRQEIMEVKVDRVEFCESRKAQYEDIETSDEDLPF